MNKKINVCIVFGGKSGEHEVSINSARSIYSAIDKDKYNISLLGITKTGHMQFLGSEQLAKIERIQGTNSDASWLATISDITVKSPDHSQINVFFPIIHGTYGEDGTLQGFFEMLGVPYVGAGVLGSAVGMDKDIMKRLFQQAGLKTARFEILRKNPSADGKVDNIIDTLGLPLFVKPANMGSSVGVSKAHSREEFIQAVQEAFKYDTKVIIEEYIKGREIEVSVLGNNDPIASIPGEIIPNHEFYSYDAKYLDENGAILKVPAELDTSVTKEIQDLAVNVFTLLECSGMARVDFFLKDNGEIYINEINTLPGFTKISMYPKLWEASGLPYPQLIDELIKLAIEKNKEKEGLLRNSQ